MMDLSKTKKLLRGPRPAR